MKVVGPKGRLALVIGLVVGVLASGATADAPVSVVAFAHGQERIDTYRAGATPTLGAAISALGRPTDCVIAPGLPTFARVAWQGLGLKMLFGTYGFLTPGVSLCRQVARLRFDSAQITGANWSTPAGLRIGDPESRIRVLYPKATRRDARWVLAARSEQVPERRMVPSFVVHVTAGKVTAFDLDLRTEGD